jgi:hypothetical protein
MNPFTMRAKRLNYLFLIFSCVLLFSCKKETEEFSTEAISDYAPLAVGKYIIYRTDSTVFTNFGRTTEIHSYQEKDIIDAQVSDGLGRPSYRVFRFLRDTAATQQWVPGGTYFITPLNNTLEIIDDNLRFVKLVLPIKKDNTWKGNRFLPDEAYSTLFSFNNDFDMASWDYTLSSTGETLVLNGKTINDVITVDGINEVINVPVTTPSAYGSINYLQDKYAKGIGIVYQNLTMWEYQPNTSGPGGGYKIGFGVTRSMIDHN